MQNSHNRGTGSLRVLEQHRPRNILVANSKGGCGKTTLATNLAAFFAQRGQPTALMDFDPQGSSTYWLKLRPEQAPAITGISAFSQNTTAATRSFHMRLPRGIERVIVDTPAGLSGTELYHRISDADLIVVPVLPSPIDIHSVANFIHDIEITGCLRDGNKQLLVIANRARSNNLMFDKLDRFLQTLGLPRVTHTRDSQLYTRAAALGLGVVDFSHTKATEEKDRWIEIGCWIENHFAVSASRADREFIGSADQRADS
jgi:chromosome partitioning protein